MVFGHAYLNVMQTQVVKEKFPIGERLRHVIERHNCINVLLAETVSDVPVHPYAPFLLKMRELVKSEQACNPDDKVLH